MSSTAPAPRVVTPDPSNARPRLHAWLAAGALVVATVLVFLNGLGGVMVFDDRPSLVRNDTITDLSNLPRVFSPPLDTTVSGRPVANLTFAVSHALAGGLEPFWYHVGNIAVHALAVLALFGVVRRALGLPALRAKFGASATPLAFAVALVWALHPLQTESVTYVVQRVEALMGLWYLATLYCFLRSVGADDASAGGIAEVPSRRAFAWRLAASAACLLGMGTKEVMVSAPLFVLLLDRTLVAGSFAAAWRVRWKFYLGLGATWLWLGWLVAGADARSGTAGLGTASSWHYLLTSGRAIVHYLRLSVWPEPLVFDYGKALVTEPLRVAPQGLLLLALAGATLRGALRGRAWALPGVLFFVALAPSSSVVPVATQTMAEHRMYLPLAAVVAAAVLGLHALGGRRVWPAWAAAAVALGFVSVRRNEAYFSELELWRITSAQVPENPRAVLTYGHALLDAGRVDEAIAWCERAIALSPGYWEAHNNLGIALLAAHRIDDAAREFAAATRIDPEYAEAHNNLAMLRHARGDSAEAARLCEIAVKLRPNYAEAFSNLALARLALGELPAAEAAARTALRLQPDYAEAHNNLGSVLHALGRAGEAEAAFRAALRPKPLFPEARHNLALTLRALDRPEDAITEFRRALRLRPGYVDAHQNLAALLADLGRPDEALAQLVAGLEIEPDRASLHFALGNLLLKLRRYAAALPACRAAAELAPDHAEAHSNLGAALFFTKQPAAAIAALERAIELKPDFAKAHYFLGNVFASQGRYADARASWEEALRANPDYEPAKQNLARLPRG